MHSHDVIFEDAAEICRRVNLAGVRDATVLVTGASGLLGTYFLATLCLLRESGASLKVQAQVYSEPAAHTVEIIRRGGFNLLRANLADFQECSALPEADIILHSAGYGQPAAFLANPLATIQINTTATATLLEKLRPGGAFLFVSTSEIYSGLKKPLAQEADIGSTTPLHPRASYIEGKRCGEAICNAARARGVRATSGRLALAYGPGTRKHDKRALNSFIERALCQRRIELLDAGKAVRTYGYVTDAVELLWQAALHGTQPVYNVGGRSTVTIAELAELIGGLTGAPVVFPASQKEMAGAPEEVRLDLSRVENEIKKTSFVELKTGLHRIIDWQRGLYLQP
jgi:UDP-glucuronate decarboxylase